MRRKFVKLIKMFLIVFLFLAAGSNITYAQNDVMMQAFYWDVPVDVENKDGTWWDNLKAQANNLSKAGFTAIWVPSPSKGHVGITDMGYGIFDHYDLGNYDQKGTVETRFGSRSELASMISTMHSKSINIKVYADVVLNHIYTTDDEQENNPAVKQYVFDEAIRYGNQYQSYPTEEIVWVIPNATSGDYYIKIKGYNLNWGANKTERGYDVYIDWTGAGSNGDPIWENEPNDGGGQFNTFPGSGRTVRAHIQSQSDVDEYKVTISSPHDIVIELTAKRETNGVTWKWQDAEQTNGYYPFEIWHGGNNLADTMLQARTNTGISYVYHTGTVEPNYSWNYTHFHPVDDNDWLGFPGSDDEIITNSKLFGNDLNTFDPVVQTRLNDWGYWLADEIGFDGFRLDFVRGFQESFVADWVKNLPLLYGDQRFIVGEYWGKDYRIKDWVNAVSGYGADVDAFDFPLKWTLKDMCNGNQNSFKMAWLNHAGMVRNETHSLPGTSVATFVDNHDTGKEHDKWVMKDFKMAYAYILTHEGRPCVFYPHYFGIKQVDSNNSSYSVTAPSSLRTDINKLIHVRKNYLGGIISVLSEVANPYPPDDTKHVYVARRQGNEYRDGAIVVINNHESQAKGLWVDSSPSGFSNWANINLVNAFDNSQTTQVYGDGRVFVSALPRSYSVWVRESDYISFE